MGFDQLSVKEVNFIRKHFADIEKNIREKKDIVNYVDYEPDFIFSDWCVKQLYLFNKSKNG